MEDGCRRLTIKLSFFLCWKWLATVSNTSTSTSTFTTTALEKTMDRFITICNRRRHSTCASFQGIAALKNTKNMWFDLSSPIYCMLSEYDQVVFGPPIKVRAYGTCPLNSAPLKSKPGFSYWNLYKRSFFLSYYYYKGFNFWCPWKRAPHLTPFCAFWISRTNYLRPESLPFWSFFYWMYQ